MTQLFAIKLLMVITLLLSTVAGYTTYRWRQDVAHEKRIQDFYKQMDQKRREDEAILNATKLGDLKNHRNK